MISNSVEIEMHSLENIGEKLKQVRKKSTFFDHHKINTRLSGLQIWIYTTTTQVQNV